MLTSFWNNIIYDKKPIILLIYKLFDNKYRAKFIPIGKNKIFYIITY